LLALQNAARLDPESFYAHYSLSNALAKTNQPGDWRLADKHYEIALELSGHEEDPPGQSLAAIALTSHGALLRRIAYRDGVVESGRNFMVQAREKFELVVYIVKNGGAPPAAATDAIGYLRDLLRIADDTSEKERLMEWAVRNGIWRDKRQCPRVFNHALYDAMPKPIDPWLQDLEQFLALQRAKTEWHRISDEYDAARRRGLQPVGQRVDADTELYDGRSGQDWSEFPILAEGVEFAKDVAPTTTEIFRHVVSRMGQVAFSVIAPGTRIEPHCGPTNEMITCHLGLRIPDASVEELGISVGGKARGWREGEWICFEDSFEHYVWNNAQTPRAVLLVNLKHPYLR